MFIGDCPPPQFWSPCDDARIILDMATAIVRVFTSEGFVVGADGRMRDGSTKAIVSDNEQKIFPVSNPDRALVYAFSGTPLIIDDSTGALVVDMIDSIGKGVARTANTKSHHDITWYVSKLWKEAQDQLIQAKKSADIGPFQDYPHDPGIICHVFFWGYYRNVPVELDLRFTHENQKILRPLLFPTARFKQGWQIYGSQRVGELLVSRDQRFSANWTNAMDPRKQGLTLAEGIEIVQNYIRACDSDAGREVDPDLCGGIGGHIHIATITPSGVAWVQGYVPVDRSSAIVQT